MVEHLAERPAHRVVTGRYELTAELGRHGTRTVWRAQDTVLRRDVAVEEVRLPASAAEPARALLLRGARNAASLPLPGTVTVFDAVREGDDLFVVTELLPARTLADVVEQDGPLAPGEAAAIGIELLGALERVEREHVVHDGVSPADVLLVDGRAKLGGIGVGPGQSGGFGSDLHALCATLHFAVTGREQPQGEPALGLAAALAELLAEDPEQRPSLPRLRQELEKLAGVERPTALVPRPVGAVSLTRVAAEQQPAPVVASDRAIKPDRAIEPAPPAAPPTRRPVVRRAPVIVAAAVAAIAAAGAFLLPDRALAPAPPATPEAVATATAPVPAPRQTASTSAVWRPYENAAAGFTIRVPDNWKRVEDPNRVVFSTPDRTTSVAVSWTDKPVNPLAELRDRAFQFRSTSGYRELKLGPVTFRGRPAAEWEFQSGNRHGRALAVGGSGHGFVLSIEAPQATWPTARQILEQMAEGLIVG